MQVLAFQIPQILPSTTKKIVRPASGSISTLPFSPLVPRRVFRSSSSLQYREEPKYAVGRRLIRSHALNVGTGSGGYDERRENDSHKRGADLLRKPAAPSPAANDEESAAEYSDDDESESKGGDGDTWVDWEDQILEDTVPLVGFVRMILHSGKYECGDRLSSDHERTILDRLLPYHPACEDKIGSGVDYITIGYHPTFGSSRCLFIVRKDGELVDFSYWKCIKGLIRKNYPLYADSFILRHFRRRWRDD